MTNRLNRRLLVERNRAQRGVGGRQESKFTILLATVIGEAPAGGGGGDGEPPPPPLPGEVTLVSPNSAATIGAFVTTLSWSEADDTLTYDLQVDDNSDFSSPIIDDTELTELTYDLEDLDNTVTYYWRVRGVNEEGEGEWSQSRSFTVTVLPGAVSLTSPAAAATNVDTLAAFTWGAATNADTYDIEISTESGGVYTVQESGSDLAVTTFTPSPALANETTYHWRVRASNAAGDGSWTSYRTFTTEAAAPAVTWLAFSDFSTPAAAPITEYTMGDGKLVVTADTGNLLSVSDGKLNKGGSVNGSDPLFTIKTAAGGGWTRTAGRMFRFRVKHLAWYATPMGFSTNSSGYTWAFEMGANGVDAHYNAAQAYNNAAPGVTNNQTYDYAFIQFTSSGSMWLIKGGVFTDWVIAAVNLHGSSGTLYPSIAGDSQAEFEFMGLRDLPSGMTTFNDWSTYNSTAASSTIAAFTHPLHFLLHFNLSTKPSSGNVEIEFRRQDANNKFLLRISGTAISLHRFDAGVPTQLATYSATINNNDSFVIHSNPDTDEINVHLNRITRLTATSATQYESETGGNRASFGVGGAISNFRIFDRAVSAPFAAELDAGV